MPGQFTFNPPDDDAPQCMAEPSSIYEAIEEFDAWEDDAFQVTDNATASAR